jgi:CRP-like cAMP-binding protein
VVKSFLSGSTGNHLLNRLPPDEIQALRAHLREADLVSGQVVYEARSEIEHVYFPVTCVLSAVTVMLDGHAIEVATIGNEGVAGQPALAVVNNSPHRVFAQIAGATLQADSAALYRELSRLPKFRETVIRYHQAFVFQLSQCVACNGLHVIVERCCRWLLMTHDRVEGDDLALTHEFLSYMLGVRRSGITEVLQSLQQQGLIRYGKGIITVLDRGRLEELACECYQCVQDEYQRLLP